jgi:hypothetical protein
MENSKKTKNAAERHSEFKTFQQKINKQEIEKFNFIIQVKHGEDKNKRVFLQANEKFLRNIFVLNNPG